MKASKTALVNAKIDMAMLSLVLVIAGMATWIGFVLLDEMVIVGFIILMFSLPATFYHIPSIMMTVWKRMASLKANIREGEYCYAVAR